MLFRKLVVDERKRKHFITLLNIGIVVFPLTAAVDFMTDNYIGAVVEVVLAACFIAAHWFIRHKHYVQQTVTVMMLILLFGSLLLLWNDILMLPWISVVVVIGFGFMGTDSGRLWAALTILCVAGVFILDLTSAEPLYSVLMAMNLIVSCIVLAFIVDYAYLQLQKWQDQLLQETAKQERLEMAKRFSENMAHLINNEMQAVIGFAEIMQYKVKDQGLQQYCAQVITAAEKTSQHANQLSAFVEKEPSDFSTIDFQVLVESVVQAWKEQLPENIHVHMSWQTGAQPCKGSAVLLKDMILSVLHNAAEAIGRIKGDYEGKVQVVLDHEILHEPCSERQLREGKYIVLSIIDNGGGVAEALQGKLFEPFVTTEFLGRGLGLAKAFGIAKQHSGAIELFSSSCSGSVFRLWTPLIS
ncbi:ATP-binding protein [Ghiorsea bivora]|uniref:ATP-binding protein n=1 Tax=Ghiorsea bivora TaxID=1485545 RepID=UPI00056E5CF8|nr:ATP-binding protein [Ghiorsea bivora]